MESGSKRLRTLRTLGGFEDLFGGGLVAPAPALRPGPGVWLETAGPPISSILRTGAGGLAVRPFGPKAVEFAPLEPRVGPVLPSSMSITSRRSSSRADSRDIFGRLPETESGNEYVSILHGT